MLLSLVLAFTSHAHAYSYTQGTASLTKPVELRGDGGETITLTSGPVSLDVNSYGTFRGDGSIVIANAMGRVTITIPRDTFKSGWVFFTPASRLSKEFGLSGHDSTRVDKEAPREDWTTCSVPASELAVLMDDGRPYMVSNRDGSGKTTTTQLRIRVCAQQVNGRVDLQQVYGFNNSCEGRQQVVKQVERTQQVYTLEILDPASGQSVGQIEALAPEKVSTADRVVRALTPCAR